MQAVEADHRYALGDMHLVHVGLQAVRLLQPDEEGQRHGRPEPRQLAPPRASDDPSPLDAAADHPEEERGWRRHRGGHRLQDGLAGVGARLQPVELVALRAGVRGDALAECTPLLRTGVAQHAPGAEG